MNTAVHRFADAAVDWLFAASWQLSLFIAIVALAAWSLRKASPRLRYGLWVLVLLKALLPPTLGGVWSVGAWGVTPVRQNLPVADRAIAVAEGAPPSANDRPIRQRSVVDLDQGASEVGGAATLPGRQLLVLGVWLTGALAVGGGVAWTYRRLQHAAEKLPAADEGPLRIALEEAALAVGVADADRVDLRVAERPTGPFLFGIRRPTIVLPGELAEKLEPRELRGVLAHELMHWRRRDTWVGWLQAVVQALFWFHPLVWWAASRLRDEREKSCDEAVLRLTDGDRDSYGEAIVRSLTIGRGRPIGLTDNPPLAAAGLVGVFERGALLQQRLEDVMNFDPRRGRFGWRSLAMLGLFAAVFLPMASRGAADTESQVISVSSTETEQKAETPWPVVVSTVPEIGATDVDPNLDEIRVTFDRDMDQRGYSWTQMGRDDESFPETDPRRKAKWLDARTCVLPVDLERGRFYRVGINHPKATNFKSVGGETAAFSVIRFATEGAKRSAIRKTKAPRVVALDPPNGSAGVDPTNKVIGVTFDTRMPGGMSWIRTDGLFPGVGGGKAWWSRDGKTCHLPVELVADAEYELGLNGSHYINFQSKWGVPLEPVVWKFSTAGE